MKITSCFLETFHMSKVNVYFQRGDTFIGLPESLKEDQASSSEGFLGLGLLSITVTDT